jgi:RNA polymerase sigma factor (sigma-70 family)
MEANDMELLREYAQNNSEQAFRTLVDRHIDFVYRFALRQVGNAQLAEDVTQAVFVVLAQKAASIPSSTVLAGWLFRATRFAAANAKRSEARREHWEQKAIEMEPPSTPSPEPDDITPLLGDALEQLPEMDRAAILLRFFESKSMEEVGRTLGTTESAAKMRLARAVEKLREIFRKRGVVAPRATLLAVLSVQSAQAAPAGLAATVATSALLNQSSATTLTLAKGTLKVMAQAKAKKLAIAAIVLLLGGASVVVVQQTLRRPSVSNVAATGGSKKDTGSPTVSAALTPTPAANESTGKVLVFRNRPSWGRHPDFEDALVEMGLDFEVKPAELMESADLSRYRVVVIPGSQSTSQFYAKYIENAARFDEYVTNGGTLLLELNGAERSGLPMPRNVNMVMNPARDNLVSIPDHPIVATMGGQPIRANYASHGYLIGVPPDAIILATEAVDGEAVPDKPTFVEYPSGKGRVLAACQCFHDRDGSRRGPMMQAALQYAAERKWYVARQ